MLNFKKVMAAMVGCMLFAAFASGCGDDAKDSSSKAESSSESSSAVSSEAVNFTAPEIGEEIAVITIKDYGDIKVKLFPKQAEKGVENFVALSKDGYYDGLIFHRIINDFMIQGGDPTGTGMGGPGYKIKDEFGEGLKHDDEGILSMANAGPNTGGSQFFITLAPTPWLNGHHAIFGKVVEGMDVVRLIGVVPTDFRDRPREAVTMEKVEVVK